MRWRLLIITSILAALVAFVLWCVVAIGIFGSARALARHDLLLLGSALLPLVVAATAGFFAYRHTARRRKLQSIITALLTLVLVIVAYVGARAFANDRFVIPRTSDVRHSR
jgi:hypothetical protein